MKYIIQGDTLKPCPFCGSEAETYYNGEDNVWQTACLNDDCGAIQFGMTNVCSERNWNVRTGSEWISVKDRLPEERIDAIVYRQSDSIGACVDMAYRQNGYWRGTADEWRLDDVTHWMPLPEPPTP